MTWSCTIPTIKTKTWRATLATNEAVAQVANNAPPLDVAAILAGVDRQLADYPLETALASSDESDFEMTDEDANLLERMDTHVRNILAGANPRLNALNTALGHNLARFHDPPPPPLTDDSITAHIAEIYAYYYDEASSEDEIPVEPLAKHRPQMPYRIPASPLHDSPATNDNITFDLSTASVTSSLYRLSIPTPMMPTPTPIMPTVPDESSSSSVVTSYSASSLETRAPSPYRPRTRLKLDNRKDSPATTRSVRPRPETTITETPLQWGNGPIHVDPFPVDQWQVFQWGTHPHGPETEPQP